jgi:tetratricopeptide (TPR) repeat protein
LALAKEACALEEANRGRDLWGFLDTLALAWSRVPGEMNDIEAIKTQRRAISLTPPDADPQAVKQMQWLLATYLTDLGLALKKQQRYVEAEPLLVEALALHREFTGEKDGLTLGAITNLGQLYNDMERFEEARELLELSVPLKEAHLPREDDWTHKALHGLERAYFGLGMHEEAREIRSKMLGVDLDLAESPDADAEILNELAWQYVAHWCSHLHDPHQALVLAQRACDMVEANGGEDLWVYLDTLALAQHKTDDNTAAIETQRRALELMPENADDEIAERLAEYEAALTATQTKGQ